VSGLEERLFTKADSLVDLRDCGRIRRLVQENGALQNMSDVDLVYVESAMYKIWGSASGELKQFADDWTARIAIEFKNRARSKRDES